jgi:hypothetical protein
MTLKPSGLPVRQFVECARCLDGSKDDSDVSAWATEHLSRHPDHAFFRTVNTASWILAPKRTP